MVTGTGVPSSADVAEWIDREPPLGTEAEPRQQRGRGRRAFAEEQDEAAGGPGRRVVRTPEGASALGTIGLSRRNGYVYAYLQWSHGGRMRARYLGWVTEGSRAEGSMSTAHANSPRDWSPARDDSADVRWGPAGGPCQGPDHRGAGPRGAHGASLGRPMGSLADLRHRSLGQGRSWWTTSSCGNDGGRPEPLTSS
jgi:hypothetical protein